MPAAVGLALLGGSELAGASLIGGITVGYATGAAALVAGAVGLQLIAQAIEGEKRNKEQITVKQAIAPRRRAYGQCKLGGYIFYFDVSHKVMVRAQLHCEGPIYQILEYWYDDIKLGLPPGLGGVVPDAVYKGTTALESHLGGVPQSVSPMILSFGGSDPWTSAMQLNGIAYTVARFEPVKHGDLIYPSGAPGVRIVAQTSSVFDPRDPNQDAHNTGTWAYSDNAALVLLDYITHASGLGMPIEAVNLDSFRAFALVCQETMVRRDGTTEPRYRSWGAYDYDEDRAEVLARLCACCDARLYDDANGLVTVRGGKWVAPTVTITSDMVVGWDEWTAGDKSLAACNQIKFTYTAPLNDYQQIEGDSWNDLDSQSRIGVFPVEQALRNCPSHSQGRRLAKIQMARKAPKFRINGLKLNTRGLQVYGEDVVNLVLPELGINTTVAVENQRLSGDFLENLTVDVYAFTASAYAWSPGTEEGNEPVPITTGFARQSITTPSNLTLTVRRTSSAGSVTGVTIALSADPVPGRSDLNLIGQYRQAGASDWIETTYEAGVPVAGPLNDGTTYEFEAAWSDGTSISDFCQPVQVTVIADPTPAPLVGSLVATPHYDAGAPQNSYATLTWAAPAATNYAGVKIRIGTSADFSAASLLVDLPQSINQPGHYDDFGRSPGSYVYFVTSVNGSGVESAPVSTSVTIGP